MPLKTVKTKNNENEIRLEISVQKRSPVLNEAGDLLKRNCDFDQLRRHEGFALCARASIELRKRSQDLYFLCNLSITVAPRGCRR